jgi:hypothetical protein
VRVYNHVPDLTGEAMGALDEPPAEYCPAPDPRPECHHEHVVGSLPGPCRVLGPARSGRVVGDNGCRRGRAAPGKLVAQVNTVEGVQVRAKMSDPFAVDHARTANTERQGDRGLGSCSDGSGGCEDDGDDIVGRGIRRYGQFLDGLDFASGAQANSKHLRAANINTYRRSQGHRSPAQR